MVRWPGKIPSDVVSAEMVYQMDIFLDRIAEGLHERGVQVKRFSKPTFTRLAPLGLKNEIAGSCDAVIEALAD